MNTVMELDSPCYASYASCQRSIAQPSSNACGSDGQFKKN